MSPKITSWLKHNRQYGKQRETAKRNLVDEQERNNDLNNQVSQLKYELRELRNQLVNVLDSFQEMLTKDMLQRSEIILFVENLRNSVKPKKQKKNSRHMKINQLKQEVYQLTSTKNTEQLKSKRAELTENKDLRRKDSWDCHL